MFDRIGNKMGTHLSCSFLISSTTSPSSSSLSRLLFWSILQSVLKMDEYLWPPEEDPGGKCSKVVVVAKQLDQRNQSGRGASNHDGNADTSDDKENLGDKVNGDIDDGKNDNAYNVEASYFGTLL